MPEQSVPVAGRRRRRAPAEPPAEPAAAEPPAEPPAEPAAEPPVSRGRGRGGRGGRGGSGGGAEPPAPPQPEPNTGRPPPAEPQGIRRSRRQRHEAPEIVPEEANADAPGDARPEPEVDADAGHENIEGEQQTALGFVASLLKRSIDFLKEDKYESDYKEEHGAGTEPYNTIKQLYDSVKDDPKDVERIEAAHQTINDMKEHFEEIGCASDLKVALSPICKNVQATLYLFLHDTATEINQALQSARDAEHPELRGFGNAYGAGNEQDEGAAPNYDEGIQEQAREAYRRLGRQEQRANNAEARRNDLQRQLEEAQARQRRGGEPPEE